jgi:hypothetical protein
VQLETRRAGQVFEIRLFLRGDVRRLGRAHNLDGAETCVWADGFDVAVLRLRPVTSLVLAGGGDHRVVVQLEIGAEVRVERIVCELPPAGPGEGGPGVDGSGNSGSGSSGGPGLAAGGSDPLAIGSGTAALHDADGPDECREPDDAGDDGDPRTRLRFVLAGELPIASREGP